MCSWVTQQVDVVESIGGYSNCSPRSRASPDMSPNGSMTSFRPSAVRVKAD
jgi:hypothetical protein